MIILLQLVIFVHYFFIISNDTVWKIMMITQNFLVSMVILAICYLFCKNSSKILPGRKKWLPVIKIIGVITAIGNIVIAII